MIHDQDLVDRPAPPEGRPITNRSDAVPAPVVLATVLAAAAAVAWAIDSTAFFWIGSLPMGLAASSSWAGSLGAEDGFRRRRAIAPQPGPPLTLRLER